LAMRGWFGLLLLFFLASCFGQQCRDRLVWPFASTSIWNQPIGSNAEYVDANLFAEFKPEGFFADTDYFYAVSEKDPRVPWYDQGHWGKPRDALHYCNITGKRVADIYFPHDVVLTEFGGNNVAAILQPDSITLLQLHPIYRCEVGSPVLALAGLLHNNQSILGDGIVGAFGGSGLSSLGGAIRKGEFAAAAINHALKLELWGHDWYYGGLDHPCYRWPARTCDGYAHEWNEKNHYNGTNYLLTPGALLAIPPSTSISLSTVPGKKLAKALMDYGGYIAADTARNTATFNAEFGVSEEFEKEFGFALDAKSGPWYDDQLKIFQALKIVANNSPTTIGGGGTPRQPLAPPICNV